MKNPKTILITGAGSGLGKALALEYAKNNIILFLCGRNSEKLNITANACKAKGAKVETRILDVKSSLEMQQFIAEICANHKLDLVIANAGISAGTASGIESEAQINEIFSINIDGVLNSINPAIKFMRNQKSGQIAIMSSLAGFKGLPSSPAYSASKAAVRVYGEGLRGSLAQFGIEVNVICPGYIKTPMTDANNFYMPFLMAPDKAAQIIKTGLEKNQSRIAFPFRFYFIVWLVTLISNKITDPIFARLPKKKSLDSNL
jgi:short-subunit dehydrogenase